MYLPIWENSGRPYGTKVLALPNNASFWGLLTGAHLVVEHDGQIDKDEQVEDGQHYLKHRDMADDFVKLPGQKRSGQDEGEVLCPALLQHQSGAFDDVQSRVEKNGEADLFEPVRAEQGRFFQQHIDDPILGVEAEGGHGPQEDVGNIFVEEIAHYAPQ